MARVLPGETQKREKKKPAATKAPRPYTTTKNGGSSKNTTTAQKARRTAYRTKTEPYNRSARSFVKKEKGPKKAAAVGKAYTKNANTKPYKKAVKAATTQTEAEGAVRNLRGLTKAGRAKVKVRKAARRSVKKGFGAATNQGLSLTKDEGSRALQKAVKILGYKEAKRLVNQVKKKNAPPSRPKPR